MGQLGKTGRVHQAILADHQMNWGSRPTTVGDRIAPRSGVSMAIGRGAPLKHLRNCPKGQPMARLNHREGEGIKRRRCDLMARRVS